MSLNKLASAIAERSAVMDHLDRNKWRYGAGLAATAVGGKLLKDRMEDVANTNRVYHGLLAGTGAGLLGHGFVPKGTKGALGLGLAAGLGTYLLDSGKAWNTPVGPI